MPDEDSSTYFQAGGDVPGSGMHALLIGVSDYPFIESVGMRDLSGPSLSMIALADWLVANQDVLAVPLKSVRLLVSPLESEIALRPELKARPRARLEQIRAAARAWQHDAAAAADGATLFYFAGHGIQRSKGDSVLLLEDFLDPAAVTRLERSIGVNNIYNGMGNFRGFPTLAGTQFYFIDACRSDLDKLQLADFEEQEPSPLFMVERGGVDDRTAPIFFGAASGKPAWTQAGVGTLFWQDLHACLDGLAAEKRRLDDGASEWVVTVGQLSDSLGKLVNRFNAARGAAIRSFNLDKFSATALDTVLRRLDKAPLVPCSIELLPSEAAGLVTLRIDLPGAAQPASYPAPHGRIEFAKEANIYQIGGLLHPDGAASYDEPAPDYQPIEPPFFHYRMALKARGAAAGERGPVMRDTVRRDPVEIRDADAALVGRGTVATLGRSLDAAASAGARTATATLPSGRKIVQPIAAHESGQAALDALAGRIRTALAQAGSDAVEQALAPLGGAAGDAPRPEPSAAPLGDGLAQAPLYLRFFRGTWEQARECDADDARRSFLLAHGADPLSVLNRGDRRMTLQLLQAGRAPLNVVLPPQCTVEIHAGIGTLASRLGASFGVPLVDRLIDLRKMGALREVSGVARTLKLDQDLEVAASHPSAAIAACFIMLRSGDLAEAARAIDALGNRLEPEPDVLLLRAELLARRAEDSAAEDGFLAAADCGLPTFSTGLAYLVDRLRMYMQSAPPERAAGVKERLVRLQRVSMRCDFSLVLANHTGMAPGAPDDVVLPQDLPVPPGAIALAAGTH